MRVGLTRSTGRHSALVARRDWLRTAAGAVALLPCVVAEGVPVPEPELRNEIGVTTGSFMRHLAAERQAGKLRLLDLPRLMRDELGMKVIDLMTATLPSFEPGYLDAFREEAVRAGCVITNLKMNQPKLDMAHPELEVREAALGEYKRTILVAARLGCRWVRPLPGPNRPDLTRVAAGYRELIDFAAPHGISLLVENYGWMHDDPDAIPAVLLAVGSGLAAAPDTGNWTDAARFDGLAKAFPHAVTCDFKAFQLEPDGSHPRYDLERCFQVGWEAGFRGPWCLEHFHTDLKGLLAGLVRIRELLEKLQTAGCK